MRRESEFELEPPWGGLQTDQGREKQPRGTSYEMRNVRLYDQKTDRRRLSKRAGISKYVATQTSAGPIQDLNQYIYASTSGDSAGVQVRRDTTNLVVSQGNLEKFTSGAVSSVTGGASAFSSSVHQIFSARLFGNVYYVDGTVSEYYVGSTNTLDTWTASTAGTLPSACRLIELWRGRIVLSGKAADPHNWFMSALADAHDFDYSPDPIVETMAVAGNSSPAGEIGDVVTSMVPFNDDILIFGCDHTIWQMTGDPAFGGRIDNVTEDLGMAWGRPWCIGPSKEIFFFGSRGGVWKMAPGGTPQPISGKILGELSKINIQTNVIRMAYDTRHHLVHLFITPIGGTTIATHYVYCVRSDAWMTDKFADYNYDPYSVYVIDADDPDDRVMLIGGKDGYIRKVDTSVSNDDGNVISSSAIFSPINFKGDKHAMLKELRAICSNNTDVVSLTVRGGNSDYEARQASPSYTRQLGPDRNYVDRRKAAGSRIYVGLQDDTLGSHWSLESVHVKCDASDGKRNRWSD